MTNMATAVHTMQRRQTGTSGVELFAWVTLGFFILVVLWGAVVRATGSGAGCGANWPLCNGYILPLHHPRIATLIEFTHRSTSGICTGFLVVLAVWIFRATPKRHRARRAVLWSVFFLITEALLGAVLVLRHWVENNLSSGRTIAQSVHFTNTLLLMGALALTAWFLRDDPMDAVPGSHSRGLAWISVVATICVGATGSLAALADTLFPSPTLRAGLAEDFAAHAPVLIRMRWLHPAAAAIALVCVALLLRSELRGRGHWGGVTLSVGGLMVLQCLLGGLDVLLLAPITMQILHLLGADLYWIALVVLAARVIWPSQTGLPS